MDRYKKIIKSAKSRTMILNMLSFIPDKTMLKLQYKVKLGRKLNLENPSRFTEKLQLYKINYKNPLMQKCVDKYLVRSYVKQCGLEDTLVKLIGKYDSVKDIDWGEVPNEFVIKTTHGGGGLNVIVCGDKKKLDFSEVTKKLESGNKTFKTRSGGREWAYYGLPPGIVIEELLLNRENPKAGINDYKIFCYNGNPQYIIVDGDRYIGHKRNFYDVNWNNLKITSDCPAFSDEIQKPKNLGEMLNVARKLSQNFPFVRVDLYDVDGKIYFGEMTFYPWSGYVQFLPDEMDIMFGKEFII